MATYPCPSHPKTITHTTVIANTNSVAIFGMEMSPTSGTTFIQADPSNFRALVQKLTGPRSNHKLPVTYSGRESVGPRIPPFKLQERKQNRKKLEIDLQIVPGVEDPYSPSTKHIKSSSPVQNRMLISNNDGFWVFNDGSRGQMGMAKASPVSSSLDFMVAHSTAISPTTPMTSREELEEKGLAEKGYYLHPTLPAGCRGSDPPALLPLFPLHHHSPCI
ncbi:VQ domain-containing protein [Heracleum sosnowskyi]|uniref:VQ domain-containing protein n=1 Tax=Heracleum sosnowskyi TaxID=360622 RepID=A0AAD8HCY5_9APIA|nr:VQ domain-containing protein [Heracleum sosnowskyi]